MQFRFELQADYCVRTFPSLLFPVIISLSEFGFPTRFLDTSSWCVGVPHRVSSGTLSQILKANVLWSFLHKRWHVSDVPRPLLWDDASEKRPEGNIKEFPELLHLIDWEIIHNSDSNVSRACGLVTRKIVCNVVVAVSYMQKGIPKGNAVPCQL